MLPAEHRLVQRVQEAYDRLTPGQRRVVGLLLEEPHEAAFMSAAEVGRRANVSDSTVVRLPAVLGYSGFPELREELQSNLKDLMAPVELLKVRLKQDTGPRATFARELENLQAVQETATPELVDSVVSAILAARTTYIIGQRSGYGLAFMFAHYLQQVRGNVRLLSFLGGAIPDELSDMGSSDALIAFSTTRYSRLILEVAEHATKVGANIIAVTDSPLAPLALRATVSLLVPVRSTSFFPSNVAAMALIQVVVSEIARRRTKTATSRLSAVDRIADEFQLLFAHADTDEHDTLTTEGSK